LPSQRLGPTLSRVNVPPGAPTNVPTNVPPPDLPIRNECIPPEVRELLSGFEIVRIWYSFLRFNVLFVARA
jgi:hypothetical protein